MKKNYKKLSAFVGLLCAVSVPLSAALSGTVTINSGAGTGGTNYQTWNAFATDINAQGISGPLTVNVVAGTYNEQVVFNQIVGATAANKITINGNGALLTFNSSNFNQPATLGMNGADYFVIKNLNVQATNSNYAHGVQLYSTADNNMFSNCTFSCPTNGTSSYHCPVVINGSAGPYYNSGAVNSNNTFESCQLYSGYFGIVIYGSGTFHTNNSFYNCKIEDFYQYGTYCWYAGRMTFKNNEFNRKTRTTLSGAYGFYLYYTNGGLVLDGNKFTKFNEMQPTGSNSLYAGIFIYDYTNPKPAGWNKHMIMNNIISDIKGNGTHYGFYFYYLDADVFHNTISFDDPNSTSGTIYGVMHYGQSGMHTTTYKSNIITGMRGGSSSKYGFYLSNNQEAVIDNNNIYLPQGGNNYLGYNGNSGTSYATLSAWKGAGYDANGYSLDPIYVSVQNDQHPTNTALNNKGVGVGVVVDQENMIRHVTTPDIGALEFLTPVCSGLPNQTVLGPSFALCPGETAKFKIGNLSSDLGWTYQWQYSTQSNVGIWTTVAGAKGTTYDHPNVTQTTWVSAIISCTAPGGQQTVAVAQVNVAGVTTNTAPYFEDFENVGQADRLPNCSWSSPQIGGTTKTHVSSSSGNLTPYQGTSFASFNNSTPGTSYFYTNKIYMYQGITYSASVFYQTDLTGASNWTDLSILYNTSQSSAGLTSIVSTNGPAIAPFYKQLGKTFTVPTSGYYNVAVRATSSSGAAQNLSIDNLRIEIPCQLNSPTITVSASSNTIFAGDIVTISANGGDSYLWSNGDQNSSISVTPMVTTTYAVTGSSDLSGCGQTMNQTIYVNPSPQVIAIASSPSVCVGKPVTLTAGGAATYVWSNSGFGPSIMITPTNTTPITVSVIGTNAYNCQSTANITVGVYPVPTVNGQVNNNLICSGDPVTLTGSMSNAVAANYQWLTSNNFILSGSPINYYPQGTGGTYTLTGTDVNGCTGTAQVNISVEPCVGLSSVSAAEGLKVYPNPNSGEFTVEMTSGSSKTISVTDVTGRVILTDSTDDASFRVNINQLAGGVYYVKVSSGGAVNVIKVVKQ